jgi:NADPH:quinone reductase-like Zn-dependent oxidoreductase
MKAAIHASYGQPRDVLRVVEVAAEEPAAGEVVVRMEAAAMHIADLRTIQGVVPFRFPVPRTPGFEGIGRVLRVGPEVHDLRPGDRVFPPRGSGTFREEVRCRARECLPAPEGDPVQLSLAMVNGATAAVLLEDCVSLAPGEWLIQNAANSNCGRYLITLARLKGVRTVNVVRRVDVAEELRALGADLVIEDGPDLAARVGAAVAGAPIRFGIDAVAGAATQRIAECLAFGATVASYGSMSQRRCEIDFYLLFMQDLKLIGVSFARQLTARRTPDEIRALYSRIAELTARGVLAAKIAGTYSLERIVEACERAALTGVDRDGKVIIRFAAEGEAV